MSFGGAMSGLHDYGVPQNMQKRSTQIGFFDKNNNLIRFTLITFFLYSASTLQFLDWNFLKKKLQERIESDFFLGASVTQFNLES